VVPLKTILDHQESSAQHQALKSLAFSVFTSCRWNLTHSIVGRSMTGFGPAAGAELFLKNKAVSDWDEFRKPLCLLEACRVNVTGEKGLEWLGVMLGYFVRVEEVPPVPTTTHFHTGHCATVAGFVRENFAFRLSPSLPLHYMFQKDLFIFFCRCGTDQ